MWGSELTVSAAGLAALLVFAFVLWRRFRRRRPVLLIDGSNAMYWHDNEPRLDTLRAVVRAVEAAGFRPGVMLDANAGYLLTGRYRHHHAFGEMLGLREADVMVVPKGNPADVWLLRAARDMNARIVTNDRYRDWLDDYPEFAEPGRLIRGGWRDGKPWFDL